MRSTGRWTCTRPIERSCNTYFWATGLITDPEQTTEMVNYLGYGQEFDLPIPTQRYRHDAEPEMAGRRNTIANGRDTNPPIRRSARAMC